MLPVLVERREDGDGARTRTTSPRHHLQGRRSGSGREGEGREREGGREGEEQEEGETIAPIVIVALLKGARDEDERDCLLLFSLDGRVHSLDGDVDGHDDDGADGAGDRDADAGNRLAWKMERKRRSMYG